jgi:hypothetical protein
MIEESESRSQKSGARSQEKNGVTAFRPYFISG